MLCVFLNNTAELVKTGKVHWCDRCPGCDETQLRGEGMPPGTVTAHPRSGRSLGGNQSAPSLQMLLRMI